MAQGQPDLTEEALNRMMELGISSRFDEVDDLVADVHSDPLKLLQGELESVNLKGRGLTIKQDLRTADLFVKSNGIAIDPMKAALGDIELTRPTQANIAVILKEADIERALNSDYLAEKLKKLKFTVDGRLTRLQPKQVSVRLPGEGIVELAADVMLTDIGKGDRIAFSAVPKLFSDGHHIQFEQVKVDAESASQSLTESLVKTLNHLLDLRNFTLSGMELQIQEMELQVGQMRVVTAAQLEEFPGS
ncbi:MAG: DUF2993 domain-containing protein [Leptolyngbyaceae bacterium]|nr:DUF2993 domain-containing protein [Leptolyngbyaceae bacterium]